MNLLPLLLASSILALARSVAAAPGVNTLAATSLSGTGATLNGTVNANASSTAVSFEYGLSVAYGSTITAAPTPVTGSSSTAVNAVLSGLTPGTVYHFRTSGTSTDGTSAGGDRLLATALPNVAAVFNAATDVPVTAAAVTAAGATVNFTLNFAPVTGTELMVVKNTGLSFINGTFSNLTQGQTVTLSYGGVNYPFVANYYGGTGNDLVLAWKVNRLLAWGFNADGQLGNNSTFDSLDPTGVNTTGVLAGKTVISVAGGSGHSLTLCSDGTMAAWGSNVYGQLGNNSTTRSLVPVAVNTTGVLAGKTVIAVAAGYVHNVALCSDSTVVAWGDNSAGQLGNNSTTSSSSPVAVNTLGVLAGKTVIAVAAGAGYSLARCSDGTVAAWGDNSAGRLGNNSTTNSPVPVAVNTSGALSDKTVIAVAAGASHSLALCSDGTVAAWGYNGDGRLGNNSTTSSSVPVAVNTSGVLAGKTVIAVATGASHSLARCSDGTVAAWGYNSIGQLGNNSTTNSSVPVAVNTAGVLSGKTVITLASGSAHTSAWCSDGTVVAWGHNYYGQLGNRSTTNSPVPVAVDTTALVSGERFMLAGGGSFSFHTLALVVSPPLPRATALAATSISGTGATLNGAVNANSNSSAVSFEYGLTTAYGTTVTGTPTPVTGNDPTAVSAVLTGLTPSTTYHYRIRGTSAAGTSMSSDRLFATLLLPNVAAVYNAATDVPVTVDAVIATGSTVTFTLNFAPVTGTELMVVKNTGLSFVNGTLSNLAQGQTVTLSYGGVNYPFVANYYGGTGNDLVLIWKANRLLAWGENTYGQLGNNSTNTLAGPEPTGVNTTGVLAGKTVISVAGGSRHSLAVCADGTLAAWGWNGDGRLGNNSATSSSVPVAVTTSGVLAGKTVITVATGDSHSVALCSDSTVVTWGSNYYGQLGIGNTTPSSVPVAVNTSGVLAGKTVVAVAAGFARSMALCSDGTIAAWGGNRTGQLGNGSTTDSSVPVAVNTSGVLAGKTVIAVAAGGLYDVGHSLALCSDGTLAAWGANYYGQFGNGSETNSSVPVAVNTSGVLAGKTVIAVAAGISHSLALCSDGTVASWGYNFSGQLGNSSTTNSPVPVAVTTLGVLAGKTVIAVAAGSSHSLARCSDGTLAAWGNNYYGQLGNRSTINSPVPVAVDTTALAVGERFMLAGGGSTSTHTLALVAASRLPSATALAATSISRTGATLNGTVNANDTSTAVSFEYGLTTAYGTTVTATPIPVTGTDPTAVSAVLTGLTPGTTYHYRIRGTSTAGTNISSDRLFATALLNLSAVYNAVTDVPVSVEGAIVSGATVNFTLNFAPVPGTELMVVKNTGVGFINGTFSNLAQGQTVALAYAGINYQFVANYYGGTGNDLVLVWKVYRLLAWGFNGSGQLGNNGTLASLELTGVNTTGVLAGKTVISVAGGSGHSLALCLDGTLAAWGANVFGQLGNGSSTNSSIPVAVKTTGVLAGKRVIAVAAGYEHSVALCSDSTVVAWGVNYYGHLGNGSSTSSSSPVAVNTSGVLSGKTVIAVAAGAGHSLALCSDGTVAAWGDNTNGQLGNNSTTNSLSPVALNTSGVLSGKTVIAVATGASHSVARCSDGTLAAWGNNSVTSSPVPVAVNTSGVLSGKTVIALTAGSAHSVARCSDGTLAAWGANFYGQLGNRTTSNSPLPVAVDTSSLAAGERFMLASGGSFSSHTLALVATPVPSPIVTSLAATSISSTGATLNGSVNANGNSAAVSFDYGTSIAYGSTVPASSTPVTGNTPTVVSATLSGLTPGTVYHFRVNGVNIAGPTSGTDRTFTTPIAQPAVQQAWRQSYFGIPGNTGNAADDADPDHDGLPNLIEWACNMDPTASNPQPFTTQHNGGVFEFTYTRSVTAMNAGAVFTVEWSDTLLSNSWNSSSVTEQTLSDNGTEQQVKALVPIGSAGHRFAHLRVTAP